MIIWKPVVGYEDLYEVSNLGGVRSHDRILKYRNMLRRGKLLTPHLGIRGYYTVVLYDHYSKPKTAYVHKLVASAFIGERPEGFDICHGIQGKLDNSVSNLSYGSRRQNSCDDLNRDQSFTSRFPGVHWKTRDAVWVAQIKFDGQQVHLGSFKDELEAAKKYREAAFAISQGIHPKSILLPQDHPQRPHTK
jgi:hypothetical protein